MGSQIMAVEAKPWVVSHVGLAYYCLLVFTNINFFLKFVKKLKYTLTPSLEGMRGSFSNSPVFQFFPQLVKMVLALLFTIENFQLPF